MTKKASAKKINLVQLDYLLSEGWSLASACNQLEYGINDAMDVLKSRMKLDGYENFEYYSMSLSGANALMHGLRALISLSQSMVPKVRLEASAELLRYGLNAKKLALEGVSKPSKVPDQPEQKPESLWTFRSTKS